MVTVENGYGLASLLRALRVFAALILALALWAPSALAEGEDVEIQATGDEASAESVELVEDASETTPEDAASQQDAGASEGDASRSDVRAQADGFLPAIEPVSLVETHYVDDDLIDTFYMDENGETHEVKAYPITQANATNLFFSSNNWCVITEDITVHHRFDAYWDKIIIADGVTATIDGGIEVVQGHSLDIYGQSEFGGTLICYGSGANSCPGIGGTCQYASGGNKLHSFGDISIHSGTVVAEGPAETAGIGGGIGCTNNGTITIYGGDVTATGGGDGSYDTPGGAAGIGGSRDGDCGTIRIFGGKVNATGSRGGAGIGCGYRGKGGTVEIHGGTVIANGGESGKCDAHGGAGIGSGSASTGNGGEQMVDVTVSIDGGTVEAYGHDGGAGIGGGYGCAVKGVSITGGNVKGTGLRGIGWNEVYAAGIGGGQLGKSTPITLGWTNENDTIWANSFEGTVTAVEGQALTDDEHSAVILSEGIDAKALAKLNGKTLRAAKKCTITWDMDDGSEPTTQEAFEGEVIRLPKKPEQLPDDVISFRGWYVGDKEKWENQVFTVVDDITVKASLVYEGYWVTVSPSQKSLIKPNDSKPRGGRMVTLTTSLPWGKRIKGGMPVVRACDGSGVTVEVSKGDEPNTYTFKMPKRNVDVDVELEDIPGIVPTFGKESLNTDGTLGLMTTVNLLRYEGLDWSGSYVEFAIDGKAARTVKVPLEDAVVCCADDPRYDAYVFNCPLTAIEMAQNIKATFHYADGRAVERDNISMKACIEGIVNGRTASGEIRQRDALDIDFAATMAEFGYYVQRFLVASKGAKAVKGYAPFDLHYAGEHDFTKEAALKTGKLEGAKADIEGSAITRMSCSVQFGTDFALNYFIQVPKGTELEGEAKFQDRTFAFEKVAEDTYRVRITGIRAYDLDGRIDITGTAGGEFSVNLSVLDYMESILTNNTFGTAGDQVACATLSYYYAASFFKSAQMN